MHYPFLLLLIVQTAHAIDNVILDAYQPDGKHERVFLETDHEIQYNLTKYTMITIANQRLHEIPRRSFVNLPHLRLLELKHDMIREIEVGAFGNLSSLMVLDLASNDLKRIVNGVFNTLPVRGLILTRNRIAVVEDGALDGLPNLVVLDLSHNRISAISSDWFQNCPKLLDINFASNQIAQVPAMAFKNLRIDEREYYYSNRYPTINLSNNRITSLASNAFSGLEEIFTLRLDKNRLSDIHPTAFEDVYKTHHLNFSANRIECVDDAVLDDLKRTSVLDLTLNPLLNASCRQNFVDWARNNVVHIKL